MATMNYSVPGEDAFDAVAWDPDLPSAKSPDESPEPVAIKPQPLAYTTVGSVVNPNFLPQLSAPNRIQREGANRRPLMSLLQGFQPNSSQRRGPAPPLNMSNSMHYAQQLGARSANSEDIHSALFPQSRTMPVVPSTGHGQDARSANSEHFDIHSVFFPHTRTIPVAPSTDHGQSARSASPEHFDIHSVLFAHCRRIPVAPSTGHGQDATTALQNSISKLSQQERDSLMLQYGAYPGVQDTDRGATSPLKPANLLQLARHQEFNIRDGNGNDARTRSGSTSGPLQGLEKMQTLQRLAKFENPMQQHARNRLSEFSVTRSQSPVSNPIGELNRAFHFPPPCMGAPSAAPQCNPLLGPTQTFSINNPPAARPPGYPQPLTAGPPGQRQAPPTGITRPVVQNIEFAPLIEQKGSPWKTSLPAQETNNTWAYRQIALAPEPATAAEVAELDRHNIYKSVKVLDTMPYTEVAQYYPRGWPGNMDPCYVPLSFKANCQLANAALPEDAKEERAVNHDKMRDNYFYYGQRRFWGMTMDEHMQELNQITLARQHQQKGAPLPPRRRYTEEVLPVKVTVEEMGKMSVAEAARPLLDGAVAAMINLYDRGAQSAREYNNFGDANPEYIDSQLETTKSLFGEDWGRATKVQTGRSSRSSLHSRPGKRYH